MKGKMCMLSSCNAGHLATNKESIMANKNKSNYFNLPAVLETDEVVRPYDGKTVTWEKRFMPELVENYKRIRRKEYCDPYFWVITEVK
jgi:hypothetical protein|tara:strand:- start:3408 stop:3671 length:264 start_codon:yes stop_codon:yes gene_type:complete